MYISLKCGSIVNKLPLSCGFFFFDFACLRPQRVRSMSVMNTCLSCLSVSGLTPSTSYPEVAATLSLLGFSLIHGLVSEPQ